MFKNVLIKFVSSNINLFNNNFVAYLVRGYIALNLSIYIILQGLEQNCLFPCDEYIDNDPIVILNYKIL